MECYNVKWQDFSDHTGNSFKGLLKEPDFLDVTLACDDDKQISAHKVILSRSSEFLKNILLRNYHQRPLILLDGVSHSDLLAVIDFIYTGAADVPKEKLEDFLRVGRKLKVKGLMQSEDEVQKLIPPKPEGTIKHVEVPSLDNVKIHDVRVNLKNISSDNPKVSEHFETNSNVESAVSYQESQENSNSEVNNILTENLVDFPAASSLNEECFEDDDDDIVLVHNDYADSNDEYENRLTEFKSKEDETNEANAEESSPNVVIQEKIIGKKQKKVSSFKCDECDHSVPDISNLKLHKFYKHGRKTYQCDQCNHKAQREKALVFHKQMKHSKNFGR